MNAFLVTLAALLATATLSAQALVTDLRPGSGSSNPIHPVTMGGVLYFLADTPSYGVELWRSDGTAAGTWMVKDINPAPGVSGFPQVLTPEFVVLGDQLLFWASDGVNGIELWRSDGTALGTNMIVDAVSNGDASPINLTVAGDRVFYFASTPAFGKELWISDGTPTGTHMVVDFCATAANGAGDRSNVGQLKGHICADGDGVNFLGSNSVFVNPCLCHSDGTAAGTHVVSAAAGYAEFITVLGAGITFSSYSSAAGYEPWFSDGTAAGTVMLGDLEAGPTSSVNSPGPAYQPRVFGGRVHFIARTTAHGYAHWTSDGSPTGTQVLFAPFLADPFARVRALRPAADRVYLQVSTLAEGSELYSTDGVAAPSLVVDFNAGAGDGFGGVGSWLQVGLGGVAVTAMQSSNSGGYELAVTNGSALGTRILVDLANGNGNSSAPRDFTRVGARIFFSASDNGQTGRELYALPVDTLGAAEAENYGQGCAGSGNLVPRIAAIGAPVLGNASFGERLEQGMPAVPCALCASFAEASVAVGGCTILIVPGTITFYGVTDAQGRFGAQVPLPNDAGLLGLQWFTQGMVLDPAGGLYGAASATDGLRIRLGR